MPRIDAAGTYHGAFPAEHAVLHHAENLFFTASLKIKYDFSHTHSGIAGSRACGRTGAAGNAFVHVRLHFVQFLEHGKVYLVEIDG